MQNEDITRRTHRSFIEINPSVGNSPELQREIEKMERILGRLTVAGWLTERVELRWENNCVFQVEATEHYIQPSRQHLYQRA